MAPPNQAKTMDERMAVVESKQERSESDINRLFDFFRKHVEREDEDREELQVQLHGLDKKMDIQHGSINSSISQQRSFFKGIVATVSVIWALIAVAIIIFLK